VASVEITALQSTRDVTPENSFIRRTDGAAIYRDTPVLPAYCLKYVDKITYIGTGN
jgi:hypothetical protein